MKSVRNRNLHANSAKTSFGLLVFALVLFATFLRMTAGEPNPNGDAAGEEKRLAVVYLIDKSTSMLWIFDELKGILKNTIRKYGPGDSVSIIIFGDDVTTLASFDSIDEGKMNMLSTLLDSVAPDSLYTNFAPAVDRSTEYLYEYFRNNVADSYRLVLVTDGRDHPSPDFVREYTIEDALTQFSDFLPGKQWSLYYVALKGQIDPELLALVDRYDGRFFDAGTISTTSQVAEEDVLESIIEDIEKWEPFEASLIDHQGEVKLKRGKQGEWRTLSTNIPRELFSGDRVSVAPSSKAVISFGSIGRIGLKENTEIGLQNLQRLPLKESVTVQLDLEDGTLWNALEKPVGGSLMYEVLTPIALTGIRGTVFRVHFDHERLQQDVAVVKGSAEISSPLEDPEFENLVLKEGTYSELLPGKPPSPPAPIPKAILREWVAWLKTLVSKHVLSRINFKQVRVNPAIVNIVFGPIKPNGNYREAIPMRLSEEYFGGETITAKAEIQLPQGTKMDVGVIAPEDDRLLRILTVSLECEPFLRYQGIDKYVGRINIMSPDPTLSFTRSFVDLEIMHSPPSFYGRMWDYHPIVRILIITLTVVLVLTVAFIIRKNEETLKKWQIGISHYLWDKLVKTRLIHFFRGRPVGHLVLCSAPTGPGREVLDLAKISRESDAVILCIGAKSASQIWFPHKSLLPTHCAIYASRKRNPTSIYLENRSGGHVTVNKEYVEDTRQLKDKDVIEMGEFKFNFIDIQLYRQVRVRMQDGSVHDGLLHYWDTDQGIFYMTEQKGDQEEFLSLPFRDVSHVRFFRDESTREKDILPHPLRELRKKQRKIVTVILKDGRQLKGFVDKKYHLKVSSGISIMPLSERSEIQYTYVPRSSIEDVEIVDPTRPENELFTE